MNPLDLHSIILAGERLAWIAPAVAGGVWLWRSVASLRRAGHGRRCQHLKSRPYVFPPEFHDE
ncbi:MAG TPA: hypothetical protein VGH15_05730 [Caulobacteraceae bacterium]|jgi:hypothetical protein